MIGIKYCLNLKRNYQKNQNMKYNKEEMKNNKIFIPKKSKHWGLFLNL